MTADNQQNSIPPLVFTIAVLGHRAIDPAREAEFEGLVGRLIAAARARLLELAAGNEVDRNRPITLRFLSALAPGADQIGARAALSHPKPEDGAPEWRFEAVLPFAIDDYAREIGRDGRGGAEEQMCQLAAKAERVLELGDWQPDHAAPDATTAHWRNRRYATLGQLLVRQADLIVALWNGGPPGGPGGTADVVQEARRSGVPVIWIDCGEKPGHVRSIVPDPASTHLPVVDLVVRRLARSRPGGPGRDPVPQGLDALAHAAVIDGETAAIERAARNVLLGADDRRGRAVAQYAHGEPIRMWTRWRPFRGGDGAATQPSFGTGVFVYSLMLWLVLLGAKWPDGPRLGEPLRRWPFVTARPVAGRRRWPASFLAQLFSYGFSAKLGDQAGEDRADLAAATANDAPIEAHAARADAIATRLGHHYRSVYVLIFVSAALAVAFALGYLFAPAAKLWFVCGEVLTVAAAAYLFIRNRDEPTRLLGPLQVKGADTHRRWMDARLIAESQRGAQMLGWIGFAGRRPVEERPGPAHPGGHGHKVPRTIWTPHFANAIAALPALPAPDTDDGRTARMHGRRIAALARAAGHVIEDQLAYHEANAARLGVLHHRLDQISLRAIGLAFVISLVFILLAWLHPAEGTVLYGWYATFKTLAAFFGGFGPALAAAAAGIRYHGDFERFAMRSAETASRLRALSLRASRLAARAEACGQQAGAAQPPLFEPLLNLMLDTQSVLDEDLSDWRFAYAARPITFG